MRGVRVRQGDNRVSTVKFNRDASTLKRNDDAQGMATIFGKALISKSAVSTNTCVYWRCGGPQGGI